MSRTALELSRTYTSFSGCDIRVVIAGQTMGSLQAISYAVQREKAPTYVLGHVDARAFSRGKRGIAGTIISLMFDKHILKHEVFKKHKFIADKDEVYAHTTDLNDTTNTADLSTVGGQDPTNVSFAPGDISSNYQLESAWYVDQIPPFDTSIIAANEHGQAAQMRIYGIEILNEGSGFSVDDMLIENQMTYICRTILPWQPLGRWDMSNGSFIGA